MRNPFDRLKISLRFKIAIPFLFLVIAMMGTVAYIFTIRELDLRVEQVKLRMEQLANNIATILSVETDDWSVYQSYLENQIRLNHDIVYIVIFDDENVLKAHALNTDWIELEDEKDLTPFEEKSIIIQLDQRLIAEESQRDLESKSVQIISGDRNLGTVKVGFSLVELNNEMQANLIRNLNLAIIFILLAIIISLFLSYKIVTPIRKLTSAMAKITKGDLRQKVQIYSGDEIGDLARTFNYMTHGLREKKFIEDFSRELGFVVELQKIARLITERITNAVDSQRGYLLIRENVQSKQVQLVSTYPDAGIASTIIKCDPGLHRYFLSERKSIAINDVKIYEQFYEQLQAFPDADELSLVLPVLTKENLIGIFILEKNRNGKDYSQQEINFLHTLVGQASFAIESALLYEELTEQERLKRELEIARNVQHSLLPQKKPEINGIDVDGICLPATEVGGDYFDYFALDNTRIGVAVADVMGKGTSAAFYMAVLKGIMISLTPIYSSPRELLIELNNRIYNTTGKNTFVTMTYAIVDTARKEFNFARAGHSSLLFHNQDENSVEIYTPEGIGLGLNSGDIFNKTIYEQKIFYHSGDLFILYTDGVTEAMSEEKLEFGEQRLISIVKDSNNKCSENIRECIIRNVLDFVGDAAQHDDITMVTVKAR
ncbi:SpoIIE family protein phosphatase [candidate division KSB1 bacterium]|nr:SpoIIE family protein phosphatase [candidate division KSB1 bacterium]